MFIYLITNGNAYKIGITKDITKRLKQLQTGNEYQLKVIKAKEVKTESLARFIEKSIHEGCNSVKTKGEWFNLDERLLNIVIKELS